MKTMDWEQIQTGDIIGTMGKSKLSKSIQKFQNISDKDFGKFSHSGVAWWCYDELFIVEAQKEGIVITNFSKHYIASGNFEAFICLRAKEYIDGSRIGEQMLPYIGRVRYDFFNLLVTQPIKILSFGLVNLSPRKQRVRRFICHEWSAFTINQYFKKKIIPNETSVNFTDLIKNDNFIHFNVHF